MPTGTYDISTLLAARFQTAVAFGVDTIVEVLQRDLDNWNSIVTDMVRQMADVTTDRQRRYGTSGSNQMQEVDEYGKGPTQKPKPGATVGFPLRLFQFNLGWTAKFLQTATPADLAQMQIDAQTAHWKEIQRQLKRAVFGSANYTYYDHLIDNVELAVKRFVNADGASIPDGPNAETFDGSTHTHYDANNGWDATALTSHINDVIEHGHSDGVITAINKANEATVRGLTGFQAYPDPRVVYRATDTPAQTLDITKLDNRAIGIFAGSEIWVKPWALNNYAFTWASSDTNKPLAYRQREQETLQGLRLAASIPDHPLYVDFMEAEMGMGVWTRTNGAVIYFGGGAYVSPTIS